MKILSVQSLAAGEGQTYSSDNNDAEIINLDDSSDESEVDVTDPAWNLLRTESKSVGGFDSLRQDTDVVSVQPTGDWDINSIDENSRDEGTTIESPPESPPESENYEQLADCPASPDSESQDSVIETPEIPKDNATVELFDSPASPDGEENGQVLESPDSPDPAPPQVAESAMKVRIEVNDGTAAWLARDNGQVLESPDSPDPAPPQVAGPAMKVRIEVNDGTAAWLARNNPNILTLHAQNEAEKSSSAFGIAQSDEDWEADSEPNPPFPEHNNGLDYAGILALRAQNRAEVDSSHQGGSSSQATVTAQIGDDRESESEANPPLPVPNYATKTRSLGSRNDATVNWPNAGKVAGSNSGCYNCEGDHRCSECPLPLNRALIKKRRQESKRNQNQRYFKDVPPPSKYGQFKPGKISNQLRSAMDIRRNELPDFIYKMRIHGYPPGYLEQAAESASCKKSNGGDSARQPQHQGGHWSTIRSGLMKYPGFTTPAPKGFVDYGSRYSAPYSNKYTLDNVARNHVNNIISPADIRVPNVALNLPKKTNQTTSQFSSSCLGYDRPTPFFNPLPVQSTMDRVVKLYHDLVSGKKISPSRDIVAEVEQTGNYCYKISENLEKLDQSRKAEEARKHKELITPSPPRRKKRCRSPSLLDPFPDSEDSLDVNLSQNTVASGKAPTAAKSTVPSCPEDDDCKIIGVEPIGPKLPLDTILIDSDDDSQSKDSKPVYLPNPLYKKPKLMSKEQLESETRARSAKSKEWGDFLAEYNIIPENNVSQKPQVEEIQFVEVFTPKKSSKLQNVPSTINASTQESLVKRVQDNEFKLIQDNKMDGLPRHGNDKLNLLNDLSPMGNLPFRVQHSHSVRDYNIYKQLHIIGNIGIEAHEKNKMNKAAARQVVDDDDDEIQIIE